jgi:ABC-type arginine transport system permease subunit
MQENDQSITSAGLIELVSAAAGVISGFLFGKSAFFKLTESLFTGTAANLTAGEGMLSGFQLGLIILSILVGSYVTFKLIRGLLRAILYGMTE